MSIIAENLSKTYGLQRAVDNISFTANRGEILGFLGPNGAGKTTTMKMLTCYITPTQGSATVNGFSIADQSSEVRKRIGYLPEHNPLYLDMAIFDYLEFVAELQGMPKNSIKRAVRDMVHTCGLDYEKHKLIGELSKGYRQRVGLAQALIHDPEILILDEPTTGLDPNQRVEIRNLIKRLGKEKTVIFSTHILPEVEATCDRVMIINKGRIIREGTTDQIKKEAQGTEMLNVEIEDVQDYEKVHRQLSALSTVSSVDMLKAEQRIFRVQSKSEGSARREIFQYCVDNGYVLTRMTPLETSLEDVFRELTVDLEKPLKK